MYQQTHSLVLFSPQRSKIYATPARDIFLQREADLGVGKGAERSEPREEEAHLLKLCGFSLSSASLPTPVRCSEIIVWLCYEEAAAGLSVSLSPSVSLFHVGWRTHADMWSLAQKHTHSVSCSHMMSVFLLPFCVYRKPHFCGLLL